MFGPATYNASTPFNSDAAAAMNVARAALLALGFEIHTDSSSELHAEGPGMTHNHQPPLVGVSRLRIQITSSEISANAVLGSVAKMKLFLYFFPPGLALSLMVVFLLSGMDTPWTMMLWVLPWLLIAPLIATALERRTTRGVDRLIRGMAQAKTS